MRIKTTLIVCLMYYTHGTFGTAHFSFNLKELFVIFKYVEIV